MHESTLIVEFGDCDEAGIVIHPKYFHELDCTLQRLLRDHGLNQRELRQRFGAVTPIIDAGARSQTPASYDAVVVAHATIDLWEDRRFRVAYRLESEGRTIVEGNESRARPLLRAEGSSPAHPGFRSLFEQAGAP